MAVPSGLFIPGLVIGAAWGRLLAIAFKTMFRPNNVCCSNYMCLMHYIFEPFSFSYSVEKVLTYILAITVSVHQTPVSKQLQWQFFHKLRDV